VTDELKEIYDILYVIVRAIQHDIIGTEMLFEHVLNHKISHLPEDSLRIDDLINELLLKLNCVSKRYKKE